MSDLAHLKHAKIICNCASLRKSLYDKTEIVRFMEWKEAKGVIALIFLVPQHSVLGEEFLLMSMCCHQ